MDKTQFAMTLIGRRYFITYVTIASILVTLIVFIQCYRFEIFGTSLLLGWDSPAYVWMAKYVIARGPIDMIHAWGYPNLYLPLLAFFGYLTGNVVMAERILPLLFFILLIYANSELTYRITKHVHIAGLAAFLTVLSINVLRIFSDLHRNLMALSLSFVVLLLVPNIDEEEKRILNKEFLFLIIILFVIAGTHFETYFVLVLSLLLYGFLTRNVRKLIILTFSCTIPIMILILLFPAYFSYYIGTVVFFERSLTVDEVVLWIGGSWGLLGFMVLGNCFFYKSKLRNNKLVSLVFSLCLTILLIVVLIAIKLAPFPIEFAYRALLLMPVPILLALATSGYNDFITFWKSKQSSFSTKKKHLIHKLSIFLIIIFVIVSSILVMFQRVDGFLTPFIPRSGYEKIMMVKEHLLGNSSSPPVFVFRGDPQVWHVQLYRNYVGAEIGEHFAYYGEIENLFNLLPSEPKIDYDPYLSQLERYYINFYFDELIGNISGPPPVMYVHNSHITSVEELMSHPIVIITPEFYNQTIPYHLKPFYVSEGIYIITPNSTLGPYGPRVTVIKNGTLTRVRSEYINPYDPATVYIRVNASLGFTLYNFTDFPAEWVFQRIEQGGDMSYPEKNPRRINDTKASIGNDPADLMKDWSSPWPEQNATLEIDNSTKKEGYASLKITGKTDSSGCLSVKYNPAGTWNLSEYSSIEVWAKSNESVIFSISLVNSDEETRTFWYLKAEEDSATTSWKRFAVNLTDYFSQTPGFNITKVDWIYLYVYSEVEKNLCFWIDDLTVDTTLDLEHFIYKDRVPVDETVVAYFYTSIEDD